MEKVLELWVRMQCRLSEERGQTAAEYMGILFVVAIIIGAVVAIDIDDKIAEAAERLVGKVEEGKTVDK